MMWIVNGIKNINVNSLSSVRAKVCESECLRIDSGVRQGCIKSPSLLSVYIDAVMKKVKMGMEKKGVRFQKEGRE